jgi:hypothetical protein
LEKEWFRQISLQKQKLILEKLCLTNSFILKGETTFKRPNPEFEKAVGYKIDSGGRRLGGKSGRTRNRFESGVASSLKTLGINTDASEIARLENKKQIAKNRMIVASNLANKFSERLRAEEQIYRNIEARKNYNTMPQGFVQARVNLRKKQIQSASDHSKENSILRAHEGNLTPQQNAINFLSTENSILDCRNNNIMQKRPDSLNLLSTNRLNILQCKEGGNSLKF